uniref:Uncharacterized protein n=1 Tax=Anguilla anguilla TaxID=7936 RepID=A0A0E9RS47_ANGAN
MLLSPSCHVTNHVTFGAVG